MKMANDRSSFKQCHLSERLFVVVRQQLKLDKIDYISTLTGGALSTEWL